MVRPMHYVKGPGQLTAVLKKEAVKLRPRQIDLEIMTRAHNLVRVLSKISSLTAALVFLLFKFERNADTVVRS